MFHTKATLISSSGAFISTHFRLFSPFENNEQSKTLFIRETTTIKSAYVSRSSLFYCLFRLAHYQKTGSSRLSSVFNNCEQSCTYYDIFFQVLLRLKWQRYTFLWLYNSWLGFEENVIRLWFWYEPIYFFSDFGRQWVVINLARWTKMQ